MSRSEPENDARHWVSNLLDVDHLFSSNYYGDNEQHDVKISHEQYAEDRNFDYRYDNGEMGSYALQEELRQLSLAGTPELSLPREYFPNTDVAQAQAQDWHSPEANYYAEFTSHEAGQEELDNVEVSSSCSSRGCRSNDGEEYYNLDLTDESDLDGEVGKRLNQMVSVPHIPRINGDIPSVDEATSDHQRLLDRLKLYDLIENKVQGDGNCQFRALSDQFYRSPEHHKFVRKQVVNQLKSHPDMYEDYVPMAYGEYLKRISKSGEWGDHVTLQAAADSYGIKILVITSFKDTCYIEILPKIQKSKRVIYLSFWAEVHYNSIYPQVDLPLSAFKKKKKWWMFRNKQKEF
ncbi:hypothetical protein Leryth_007577 [Lithospermum erythrorhizon]|nr:hypothetical protein Leryth_007577 [Lithospermum erythrorhizon]